MTLLLVLSALLVQDQAFPEADPKPAIASARKKASEENRQVLVVWGSNDSEESRAVASILKSHKELKKLLLYEYDLVFADVRHADAGMKSVMEKERLPWLALPAPDGTSVGYYNPPPDSKEWIAFLKKNQRAPKVAKEVLEAGKKKAVGEKKRVLLTFGAPW